VTGSAGQIRQALLELGSNAFHAMSEGGSLDFRAYRSDDGIHVAVHDTGCGMTPSVQRRIFQSLYLKGLAIVKQVMAAHDGGLGFESRAGEGTLFLMTFPAWQPEPEVTSLQ
jgi:signal transduction histidine kinase